MTSPELRRSGEITMSARSTGDIGLLYGRGSYVRYTQPRIPGASTSNVRLNKQVPVKVF